MSGGLPARRARPADCNSSSRRSSTPSRCSSVAIAAGSPGFGSILSSALSLSVGGRSTPTAAVLRASFRSWPTSTPAPVPRTLVAIRNPAAILRRDISMALCPPFTRFATDADTSPVGTVLPAVSWIAALSVVCDSAHGTPADEDRAERMKLSAAGVSPRRISRVRSSPRPRERRLSIVPTGQRS